MKEKPLDAGRPVFKGFFCIRGKSCRFLNDLEISKKMVYGLNVV